MMTLSTTSPPTATARSPAITAAARPRGDATAARHHDLCRLRVRPQPIDLGREIGVLTEELLQLQFERPTRPFVVGLRRNIVGRLARRRLRLDARPQPFPEALGVCPRPLTQRLCGLVAEGLAGAKEVRQERREKRCQRGDLHPNSSLPDEPNLMTIVSKRAGRFKGPLLSHAAPDTAIGYERTQDAIPGVRIARRCPPRRRGSQAGVCGAAKRNRSSPAQKPCSLLAPRLNLDRNCRRTDLITTSD